MGIVISGGKTLLGCTPMDVRIVTAWKEGAGDLDESSGLSGPVKSLSAKLNCERKL